MRQADRLVGVPERVVTVILNACHEKLEPPWQPEIIPVPLPEVGDRFIAVEADHGRLKSRLRPMRGLKRLRSAQVISTGHAFVQNLHRGHYELAVVLDPNHRIPAAFTELAPAI
jgi:DDE domain